MCEGPAAARVCVLFACGWDQLLYACAICLAVHKTCSSVTDMLIPCAGIRRHSLRLTSCVE